MQLFETEKLRFEKLSKKEMLTLKGKGNHVGSAIGKTVFFSPTEQLSAKIKKKVGSVEEETMRYFDAHKKASTDLRRIYGELRSTNDAAWIFLMQLTLLEDDLFARLPKLYLSEGKGAEETVRLIRDYFLSTLCGGAGGENLVCLSLDVDDVALRMLAALGNDIRLPSLPQSTVLVSSSPLPSFIAENRESISGIVTHALPKSSNVFELALSLRLPLICTDEEMPENLAERNALLDGAKGCLYIDPDLATLGGFTESAKNRIDEENEKESSHDKDLLNKEGKKVFFLAELDSLSDAKKLRPSLCDGIGKFSSEELYLIDMCPPDEELLFEEYRKIAETVPTKPIIIRALRTPYGVHLSSIASDSDSEHGELYVTYDSTLKNQLRAVMRAAAYGTLSFCLPCAVRYSDLITCASLVEEISGELYDEEREYNPIPLGVAVCDAASALMCDKLLEECDFLIIELEKLSESLSLKNELPSADQEDSVALDALRKILENIRKSALKKKKRVILSLGKNGSLLEVVNGMVKDFTFISASLEELSKIKKGWRK